VSLKKTLYVVEGSLMTDCTFDPLQIITLMKKCGGRGTISSWGFHMVGEGHEQYMTPYLIGRVEHPQVTPEFPGLPPREVELE
jgi:hypothetical protein